MQTCKLLSALGVCALITAGASAATITPVSATANSEFNAATGATNTVNDSGLSVAGDLSATHDPNPDSADQWHTAVGVTGNTNITFDLGGLFNLTDIHIWQHNQHNTGFTNPGLNTRGVDQFDVLVSSDGVNFTEVLTDGNLAISPETSPGVGGPISAQVFGLAQAGISHVQIHVDTNHGDVNVVGLSEVKFEGNPVPEPGSLALLGLAGLAILRRRR